MSSLLKSSFIFCVFFGSQCLTEKLDISRELTEISRNNGTDANQSHDPGEPHSITSLRPTTTTWILESSTTTSKPHNDGRPNDMDFGSVPTTVWMSFAIPFLSIIFFLIISSYIYRRIDKSRRQLNRHSTDPRFYDNRPAIIDNLFDESQRTYDSRLTINGPPPSYDKVVLEMTELPPSYESLQNIYKNQIK